MPFDFIIFMEKRAIQEKILRKLMAMKPAKWGASHTEEKNLVKSLPMHGKIVKQFFVSQKSWKDFSGHLRGQKVTVKAIEELFKMEFLLRMKKTGEWHVSLNPRKKEEIYRFLGLPPRD